MRSMASDGMENLCRQWKLNATRELTDRYTFPSCSRQSELDWRSWKRDSNLGFSVNWWHEGQWQRSRWQNWHFPSPAAVHLQTVATISLPGIARIVSGRHWEQDEYWFDSIYGRFLGMEVWGEDTVLSSDWQCSRPLESEDAPKISFPFVGHWLQLVPKRVQIEVCKCYIFLFLQNSKN